MSYGVNYKVTLTGDKAFVQKLNTIASKLKTGTGDVLDKTSSEATKLMQQYAPVFTGKLKQSIDWEETGPLSREIGPKTDGSKFSPDKYGTYVDSGGGPSGMPNVDDIGDRMGIGPREAFAFSKFLRSTGKAFRTPTYFVGKVAGKITSIFESSVNKLFAEAIK
jgi:hypothetical protein